MNNNLISLGTRTPEERKLIAQKGGQKSGEIRRRKRTLKADLLNALATSRYKEDGIKTTLQEDILTALIEKALAGDVRAFEVIRDTIGEKPVLKKNEEEKDSLVINVVNFDP